MEAVKVTFQYSVTHSETKDEEDKKKAIFKDKTHKSNPKSLKNFGQDYLAALEYIGVEF